MGVTPVDPSCRARGLFALGRFCCTASRPSFCSKPSRSASPPALWPNVSSRLRSIPLCTNGPASFSLFCFFPAAAILALSGELQFYRKTLMFMHLISHKPCIGLKCFKYIKCIEFHLVSKYATFIHV